MLRWNAVKDQKMDLDSRPLFGKWCTFGLLMNVPVSSVELQVTWPTNATSEYEGASCVGRMATLRVSAPNRHLSVITAKECFSNTTRTITTNKMTKTKSRAIELSHLKLCRGNPIRQQNFGVSLPLRKKRSALLFVSPHGPMIACRKGRVGTTILGVTW